MLRDEALCAYVSPSVRMYATKCHREQTAGHKSAILCTHMHVDKVSSPEIFQRHRQSTSLTLIFKVQIRIEYISKFIRAFSVKVTNRAKIVIQHKSHEAFRVAYYTYDLVPF